MRVASESVPRNVGGVQRAAGNACSIELVPAAPYAPHAYDATFLVALAIEIAETTQRNKVSAALRAVAAPR